ncbi:MAG: hypothetical protein U0936_19940 [Planctomycetaceae bacterium]
MSQLTHDYSFPSVMREKLQAVRWRQAGLSAVRAVAMAGAVLLLLMIAAMSIDWIVTLFDTRIRIALTALTLVGSLFVLLRTGVRPVIEAFGWSRAAGNVDEKIPQLEERWKTVASFAESNQQPVNNVARAMLQQVTSEAVAMSTLVRPGDVATSAPVKRPLMVLAGAAIALIIFLFSNLAQTSVLWQRFWSPTANISATQLQSLTGDVIVPRGQSLEIVVGMKGLQRDSATMSMAGVESSLMSEDVVLEASTDKPETLTATVDVDESFRYRVQAGDGRTEWFTVTAIDFPVLSEIRMTVTPPQYVDEPVTEKTLIPGRLRAVQGSQLELAMKPEQDLKSLTLLLTIPADSPWLAADESNVDSTSSAALTATTNKVTPEEVQQPSSEEQETPPVQKQLKLTKGSDGWYHFETQLIADFALSPMLLSPHGLSNENPRTCQIEVIEDRAPTARIVGPEAEASAAADETIEIKFEAHDDHGVQTAELVVYSADTKEGEEPKVLAVKQIPLGDQELRKHVMGKTELNLKELGLEEGQNISYAIRVTDNRDLEMDPAAAREQMMAAAEEKSSENSRSGETSKNATSEATEEDSDKNAGLASNDKKSQELSGESSDPTGKKSGQTPEGGDQEGDEGSKESTLIADAGKDAAKPGDYEQMLDAARSDERKDKPAKDGSAIAKDPSGKNDDSADQANAEKNEAGAESDSPAGDSSTKDPSETKADEDSAEMKSSTTESGENNTNDAASGDRKGDGQSEDQQQEGGEKKATPGSANPKGDGQEERAGENSNDGNPNGDEVMPPEKNSEKGTSSESAVAESSKNSDSPASNAEKGSESNAAATAQNSGNKSDNKNASANSTKGADEKREMTEAEQQLANSENTQPAESRSDNDAKKNDNTNANAVAKNNNAGNKASSSNGNNNIDPEIQQKSQKPPENPKMAMSERSTEPQSKVRIRGQQSDAGQQQETDRRRLRISDRLDALAKRNEEQIVLQNPVREKVVQIDEMLKVVETRLTALYKHEVDEILRGDGFSELDVRLGDIEGFINDLNLETQNTAYEFIGLQMIEISSSHVTPARDAVFVAIRRPDAGADAHTEEALHHVVSAREMLAALLKRYDSVKQEQELAKKIDDAIKMYTVYVEGSQQLMREAEQNKDPLKIQRTMAVIELDQAYLDRLAEVTRMRRDMMSELAKILGDDPRLRSRYLDLIRRRRANLRSQLAEITARQDQSLQEVLGWLGVSEEQRENYWLQISDLRLDVPKEMAKEAQLYSERIEKQLPLVLDGGVGTSKALIALSKQIAVDIFRCDFEVRELRKSGGELTGGTLLTTAANDVSFRVGELLATLDQLAFDNEGQDGVAEYVQLRKAEYRILADRADAWADTAGSIEKKRYSGLARQDQHQITLSTELLRIAMLEIEADLAGQFNEEVPMPQEVINLTQDLLRTMEAVTFNQSSATFQFTRDQIEVAAARQEAALKGLDEAGKILDQLRRKTVEALDKIEVEDPNIADLEDPTLDEFLAGLEREPDIEAQLGLPNRPRNLRVIQDMLTWSQNGQSMLQSSSDAAMARSNQKSINRSEESLVNNKPSEEPPKQERQMTEEEKKQLADAKDMKQMLKDQMQQTMPQLQQKADDPNTPEAARRQMQEMAQRMNQALEEMKKEQSSAQMWQQIVEADQAKAALEALAKGESLPDEQWNKLMSKLDDGLGQVGGRTPPEDYRRAIEQYQERIRRLTGAASE